jgi:hypothetical protein
MSKLTLFPVSHPVEKIDGTTEVLALGYLPLRSLYTWTHHLAGDRIPELVAHAAGKPLEWVDTLTDEAFAALSAKVIQLNFPRAMTLAQTDPIIAVKLAPLVNQFANLLRSTGVMSNASSHVEPPSASAEATPQESST